MYIKYCVFGNIYFYLDSNNIILGRFMVKAFLTLNTLPDKMEKVLNDIKEIKGVEQAHTVYGIYDIIAEVRGKDVNELKGLILKVRKMPDVLHTLIQIVVK